MTDNQNWNINSLHAAFQEVEVVKNNEVGLTLVAGAEPSLKLTMREYGGLPIFVAVVGDHMLVDTVLVEAEKVKDAAGFNAAVLRTRDMFPLSSIGIQSLPTGESVYTMFGALSASSSLTNIVQEVQTLAANVAGAAEAFEEFFTN